MLVGQKIMQLVHNLKIYHFGIKVRILKAAAEKKTDKKWGHIGQSRARLA